MSESPKEIDRDKVAEALLPYCREARINGKWVKGGRYYAYRRQLIARRVLELLYIAFIGYEGWIIASQVEHLMR